MPCFPYFPTFSAEPERRESVLHAFPISIHLVLALNVGKAFASPYFPTFSAEPERKECFRPTFPISLHLVLALNVGKVFALLSLFPYI